MGKLTPLQVRAAKAPGSYPDGGGLMLVVKPSRKEGGVPTRSWILRIQVGGQRRDFGCGSAERVSLKDAREKADSIRKEYEAGLDPVAERKKRQAPPVMTFKAAAEQLHKELKPSWKPGKHGDDWLSSLERHAYGKLGKLSVDKIDGPLIRDTLLAIWLETPETARRVRQRIGAVLDWAYSRGLRETEAPLRSVTRGLPRQPARKNHFAAMPYPDVPAFYARLAEADQTMGRIALRLALLTAVRSGEIRGAMWPEFDLTAGLWTIPAGRMKAKEQHTVPLCAEALALLRELHSVRTGDLLFPGAAKPGLKVVRPISDMTLLKVMRDAKEPFTVHGFRSSFRDWAGEQTSFPGEVAEAALAHVVKNPTERAYHRTKYLEKRRELMEAWARFVTGTNNVVRLAVSA